MIIQRIAAIIPVVAMPALNLASNNGAACGPDAGAGVLVERCRFQDDRRCE